MARRTDRSYRPCLGTCLVLVCLALPAQAAEKDMAGRGEVIVREHCSRCHAVGTEGDSPHKDAPPFRTLSAKYPVADLAESLAEGIVSGHPDMPVFVFSAPDVAAIIGYLESIQERPAASPEAPE